MIKNDDKGFTLVEVMIGAGILAVAGYFLMKSMGANKQASVRARNISSTRKLVNDISFILENEATCRATFQGKSEGSTVNSIADDLGNIYFQVGEAVINNSKVILTEIKLKEFYTESDRDFATIELGIERKLNNPKKPAQKVTRTIQVKIMKDGSNITTCSKGFLEEENRKLSCEQVGGTYVPAQSGVPAFCDETIALDNCTAYGGTYDQAAKKCNKSNESICLDLGGAWSAGKCVL